MYISFRNFHIEIIISNHQKVYNKAENHLNTLKKTLTTLDTSSTSFRVDTLAAPVMNQLFILS